MLKELKLEEKKDPLLEMSIAIMEMRECLEAIVTLQSDTLHFLKIALLRKGVITAEDIAIQELEDNAIQESNDEL